MEPIFDSTRQQVQPKSPNQQLPTHYELSFHNGSIRGSVEYGSGQLREGYELCLHGREQWLV